ncbi:MULTISPECIES: replication initiation protein [Spirosoma]|uniref:Replication initiation protein n=1 Tax=Spirosoma liriopis TaxID=2937440 RepID=A0ABT0HU43_9BACT|nr:MULTISPECIES: replication initiation protein [Spirosoma]MCK8495367.1 replication initiation protein [Spirosoma liriopis]UHG94403.1 replication initiation protein [Spirosoma oryzicola]
MKRTPSNQLTLLKLDAKTETLFQANALTNAYYDMSALQKNILYMVQSQIKKDDPDDKRYVVRVKDIMAITDTANPYKSLQLATEGMMQKIMNIPVGGKLLQVAPFSSVLYDYGKGTMTFKIDSDLRPFLFNLENGRFTTFGKEPAMNLPGKYSKRIYEMLSSWKKAGLMKISILELKTRLRLYDPVTEIEQYEDWRDFNKRVLIPAVKEINHESDLHVEYFTQRVGKRIAQLKWVIKTKTTVALEVPPTVSELHERMMTQFKLRSDQIEFILARFEPAVINKKLYEIQLQNASKKISNIGGYTAKVFGVL